MPPMSCSGLHDVTLDKVRYEYQMRLSLGAIHDDGQLIVQR